MVLATRSPCLCRPCRHGRPNRAELIAGGPRIYPTDPEYLARLGRYIVRVPMPSKDVRLTSEGQVRITTLMASQKQG